MYVVISVFVIKCDETVYFIKIKISGIICNFIRETAGVLIWAICAYNYIGIGTSVHILY